MEQNRVILILLGIILLGASFLVDNEVPTFVEYVENPVFDYFFSGITHFGNVFIVLILITSMFLWNERKREWIGPLWSAFISSIVISYILKFLIARPRPIADLSFAISAFNFSFPSTHAAAAFAALPILDKEFPKFKWFWISFVMLVGLSRIYLGMHYLSDVIGGALLGYTIGFLFVYIEDKYKLFRLKKF